MCIDLRWIKKRIQDCERFMIRVQELFGGLIQEMEGIDQ